ncbi:MAG: ribosome silencing factor [Bacteroidota bacterium]
MSTTAKLQANINVTHQEMMDVIIDSIRDIKGNNILKIDLRKLHDAPTDFFVICDADSTTQVKAIADRINLRVKNELGELPNHVEGTREARWVCLDYFDTVIHVFHKESREFYDLEDLWSDADITEYETL